MDIIVNKNHITGNKGTAAKPSGIRRGTPAMTSGLTVVSPTYHGKATYE